MNASLVPEPPGAGLDRVPSVPRLAWFVSPHGFGHAARSAAVMEALGLRLAGLELDLWTTVPEWFFRESLTVPFRYRPLACDVGLVQKSPVEEDLPATVAGLERWWTAVEDHHLREVVGALVAERCDLAVCDIAPFGLVAAREAGVRSVLLENFTWDWIYEPLVASEPRFASWVESFRSWFALADLRIQMEPVCAPARGASVVPPVARSPRSGPMAVRQRLGLEPGQTLVLVSLGGVEHRLDRLAPLRSRGDSVFVLPGAADAERWEGNLRLLPHRSPVHHPDLVAAADLLVGKLGYSTVAEAVAAGTRMLYVPRPGFRESAVLERYVAERLPSAAIAWEELESGAWVARMGVLLAARRPVPQRPEGSAHAAEAIAAFAAAGGQGSVPVADQRLKPPTSKLSRKSTPTPE